MKKINLILCACAVALAGLMVSCKNGNVDKIDATWESTGYIYKVSGTITTTSKSGTTTATDTIETTYTIKDAYTDRITTGSNEAWESNKASYSISLNGGEISVYLKSTPASGTTEEYVVDNINLDSSLPVSLDTPSIPEFGEIDGDLYVLVDHAWVSAEDAFDDGYVGDDEFTFKFTTAAYDGQMSQANVDANRVNNSSTTYDLTFTLVGEE